MVKNLPAMWETRVLSLGQEDPLEKGMVTHSSVLAWRIPGTEEPGGLEPLGSPRRTQHSQPSFHMLILILLNFCDDFFPLSLSHLDF